MYLRILAVLTLIAGSLISSPVSTLAANTEASIFDSPNSFKSQELTSFPALESKDILAIDAPSDDGSKVLLIWKYPYTEAKSKLTYVVAWSANGKDWSPRDQMIESPCDPDQSMRVKDYWELNEPRMYVMNRFEHLGPYKEFFVLEFTDFNFLHLPSQDWLKIIRAAKTGIINKVKEDIRFAFNDIMKDRPDSLVDYQPQLDAFLANPELLREIDELSIWGESSSELLNTSEKLYKDIIQRAFREVFPAVYGDTFAPEQLSEHLPKYKIQLDNPLLVALDDKYTDLKVLQKNYKISSNQLSLEEKFSYVQLNELHLAVGVYSTDAPEEIRWLNTNSIVKPKSAVFAYIKLNVFLIALFISGVFFFNILMAKKNQNIKIRRINGLEAVDDAIGRATEMGKAILYHTGADPLDYLSTLAAVTILGKVALKVADYECDLIVPARDPIVLTVCQEVVREAYMNAGRIDAFKEENLFFLSDDQFAYTAAVNGIMMRDKPAANFLMGYYYAEALLLAETGAATGAIQIAGTDAMNQLPFFICTCDYTLIGEELYAASAYLSREPLQMGSLRGQDTIKLVIMVVILIGCILPTISQLLQDFLPKLSVNTGLLDFMEIIFYPFM